MSALLPVSLDLSRLSVLLIGNGARAERRLRLLDEAGATRLRVFSADPGAELSARAGDRLRRRLPEAEDFKGVNLAFVADLEPGEARAAADRARAHGALVNAEDVTEQCDFHSAAVVRRGDLVLGIATGGRCPMLARALKDWLERVLPLDFAAVAEALSSERKRLRAAAAGTMPLEAAVMRAVSRLRPAFHGRARPIRAPDQIERTA
jgi:siroheme synthase-like protein